MLVKRHTSESSNIQVMPNVANGRATNHQFLAGRSPYLTSSTQVAVETDSQIFTHEKAVLSWRWCMFCNGYCPPRSHHCKVRIFPTKGGHNFFPCPLCVLNNFKGCMRMVTNSMHATKSDEQQEQRHRTKLYSITECSTNKSILTKSLYFLLSDLQCVYPEARPSLYAHEHLHRIPQPEVLRCHVFLWSDRLFRSLSVWNSFHLPAILRKYSRLGLLLPSYCFQMDSRSVPH